MSALMEEAIRSSQIKGEATTRRVAKVMLRKNIHPEIAYNKVKRGYLKSSRFDELLEEGLAK